MNIAENKSANSVSRADLSPSLSPSLSSLMSLYLFFRNNNNKSPIRKCDDYSGLHIHIDKFKYIQLHLHLHKRAHSQIHMHIHIQLHLPYAAARRHAEPPVRPARPKQGICICKCICKCACVCLMQMHSGQFSNDLGSQVSNLNRFPTFPKSQHK